MKNTLKRKRYDTEFKKDAVELVLTGHRTCRSVERDLGIGQGILHRWIQEYQNDPHGSFRGNGRARTDTDEITGLRREISILKTERDILKKALAIFSMVPGRFMRS